jgi:hypothetical protein
LLSILQRIMTYWFPLRKRVGKAPVWLVYMVSFVLRTETKMSFCFLSGR